MAMPTGQVLRWHFRIMMQPSVISGAVEKPNSSAPSIAAITTSRPVLRPPSVCRDDAAAQIVHHQRLVRLGNAQFPRQTGMFDAGQWRSTRAAAVPGDEDVICVPLGHAGGNCADADFGNQLHADSRPAVSILQIVDQLLEILD